MNCKKYEKMIYLYKELSENQKENLNLHLDKCQNCKIKYLQVQKSLYSFSEVAKSNQNQITNPNLIKNNILNSLPEKPSRSIINVIFQKVDIIFSPISVKVFASIIILFLCGHEFYMMKKISNLEQQLSVKNSYPIVSKDYKKLTSFKSLVYSDLSEENLLEIIETQLKISIDLFQLNNTLLSIPELKNINIQDGLNKNELNLLRVNSQKIIFHYTKFISKGEFHV